MILIIMVLGLSLFALYYKALTIDHTNSSLKATIKFVCATLWMLAGLPYWIWFEFHALNRFNEIGGPYATERLFGHMIGLSFNIFIMYFFTKASLKAWKEVHESNN